MHPHIAIHLAQWLSPEFAVDVSIWVARYISGDISLVPEVVARHDEIHATTSSVLVRTVSNDILEAEMRIETLQRENEQTALQLQLNRAAREERERELTVRRQAVEITSKELDNKERNLTLETNAAEAKLEIERKRIQTLEALKETDVQEFVARRDELTSECADRNPDLPVLHNLDLTTLAREVGFKHVPKTVWYYVGPIIMKEYLRRYGTRPRKVQKLCNGAIRSVNLYTERDYNWIKDMLRRTIPQYMSK